MARYDRPTSAPGGSDQRLGLRRSASSGDLAGGCDRCRRVAAWRVDEMAESLRDGHRRPGRKGARGANARFVNVTIPRVRFGPGTGHAGFAGWRNWPRERDRPHGRDPPWGSGSDRPRVGGSAVWARPAFLRGSGWAGRIGLGRDRPSFGDRVGRAGSASGATDLPSGIGSGGPHRPRGPGAGRIGPAGGS